MPTPGKIESIEKPEIKFPVDLPVNWPQRMQAVWQKTRGDKQLRETIWRSLSSTLGLGVIVLFTINSWLCVTQPFASVDPAILPATHTWTWWATQEYLQNKPAPPAVLLGSSLFMHPIAREDADFLNQDFDYVHHHYSLYLGKQLQNRFRLNNTPLCFNFSLPGDLVSDQYMVARSLFHGQHKPSYIILGLSLRDFLDNAVHCPGTTPPFRYLKRFTDIDDIVNLAFPEFWQRFDYYFGQFFYPWAKKLDIQALASEEVKHILGPLANKFCSPCLLNDLDYRKHVPANLHSEVEEGMAIIKAHIPYSYDPNYADYKKRYGQDKNNLRMFNIQKQFFAKLVALCKEQKIKLIILNMPLTKENMDLMPEGSYQRYIDLLQTKANEYGFPLIDLNGNPAFVKSDYYDTAHMNSSGGKKLLDILANSSELIL